MNGASDNKEYKGKDSDYDGDYRACVGSQSEPVLGANGTRGCGGAVNDVGALRSAISDASASSYCDDASSVVWPST